MLAMSDEQIPTDSRSDEIVRLQKSRDEWAARAVFAMGAPVLTDEEREAIQCGIAAIRDRFEGYDDCEPLQATLRALLERTK